ncbi:MAG: DmsE family decaheme c-type cytochrome [Vicinamibacterales bacterium]|nr:DmsE family decaheme c-type cytochrome [Vicinamibacterales bacterium]
MQKAIFVLALTAALGVFGGAQASAQSSPPGAWTVDDCTTCHETTVKSSFERTPHAQLADSCANCHPNVAEHAKAQMAGESNGPVPTLKNLKASEIITTCLKCHEKAKQANFLSSMHARRNVACTSCHSVHAAKSTKAQLKTKNDSDICFTCHKSERAMAMRTSHHPVREGKIGCASCHNPHDGSRPKLLKADSVNELCYTCHAEKRGPFLFEHAPVREDCVLCHQPHGSNHKRLLVQKLPNLCWNCHLTGSGHFGSGDTLSTEQGARVAPAGAPSGFPTVNSRFVEKACKNCHMNIHGSNSPSGAYFQR